MVKRKREQPKRLGVISKDNIGHFKEISWTALMILYAFFNDELILIVIHGKQGYGKSTLASIVSAQVYGALEVIDKELEDNPKLLEGKSLSKQRRVKIKLLERLIEENREFTYDWNSTKENFAFKPKEFILLTLRIKKKKPMCIVDDAGMWLNNMDYHNPFVRAVGRFFEVARTKLGAIVFTCSDLKQVFTKLRNMPHVYTIRIIKDSGGSVDDRIGIIHEGWESEDLKKSGRKKLMFDGFVAEMPDKFYRWYKPIRDKLADEGTRLMFEEFEKMAD